MADHRLVIPVDEETFQGVKFIPDGIRAEVYRSLIRILIQTQKSDLNTYIADDLVNDRMMLVRKDQVKEEFLKVYEK